MVQKKHAIAVAAAVAILGNPLVAEEATVKLSEVTVTSAAGFEQKITDAPASITVITAQELEEKRYSNLAQALGDVEGIDIGSTVGKTGGRDIRIRGMDSSYTLVLIDGKRQNTTSSTTPNGFGETASGFMPPLSAIERIEVIKGPMSTLYGSDAMGGVINIITKKVSSEWTGSVTIDQTIQSDRDFGGTQSNSIYLSGPVVQDLLGLQLRGSLLRREASDLEASGDASESVTISKRGPSPVKSEVSNIGARLTLTPHESHDISLDVDVMKQKYDNKNGDLGTLGATGGYEEELQFNKEQLSLSHTGRYFFGTWDTSITNTKTEKLGRLVVNTGTSKDGTPRTIENTNLVFDTKVVVPFDRHMLSVGGQYIDAKMEDGIASDNFEQDTKSIFAENEWMILDNLALTLGARYDDHSSFGGNTSPRAYLVWSATDKLTFKGGVSTGYKTPGLDELHDGLTGLTGQGTNPTIGTPSLKPEKSVSTEIAAYYDTHQGANFNITLFQNDFKDKITSGDPIANCEYTGYVSGPCYSLGSGSFTNIESFRQSTNVDKAETYGLEAGAGFDLPYNFNLKLNYTYTDSKAYDADGKKTGKLNAVPEHMANANLSYTHSSDLRFWLKGEYRGKRARFTGEYENLTAANQLIYDQVGKYYAEYMLFHLGASYKIAKNVTLNATIYNLFNKDFLEYEPYVNASNTTSYAQKHNIFEEPRRFWLSVNATF